MATKSKHSTFFITLSPPSDVKLNSAIKNIARDGKKWKRIFIVREKGSTGNHRHYHILVQYKKLWSTDNIRRHYSTYLGFPASSPLYMCRVSRNDDNLLAYMTKEIGHKIILNKFVTEEKLKEIQQEQKKWNVKFPKRRRLTFDMLPDILTEEEIRRPHLMCKKLEKLHNEGWNVVPIVTNPRKLRYLSNFLRCCTSLEGEMAQFNNGY